MKKKTVVKKQASKSPANKPDIKLMHELVDNITNQKGEGIIVMLDSKSNKGVAFMHQVDTELVSSVFLSSVKGRESQVLNLMNLKMLMHKI